jgi:hypothetical protein
VVLLEPVYLALYERAAHLRGQLTREEYLGLFEAMWVDRASAAGWRVNFYYEDATIELHFSR